MINRSHFVAWLALLAGTAPPVQSSEPAAPEVDIRFTVLAWQRTDQVFHFDSSGNVSSFELPTQYRSQEMRYVGDNPLVFFREESGPEGQRFRVPLAKVEVDPAITKQLLLFVPGGGDDSAEFKVLALDDRLEKFPQRSYRFFNLTDEKIGVALNDRRVALETYDNAIIELDRGDAMIQLGVYARRGEGFRDVLNSRWPQRSNERYIIFVIDSPHTQGSLATKAVPEYFEP